MSDKGVSFTEITSKDRADEPAEAAGIDLLIKQQ